MTSIQIKKQNQQQQNLLLQKRKNIKIEEDEEFKDQNQQISNKNDSQSTTNSFSSLNSIEMLKQQMKQDLNKQISNSKNILPSGNSLIEKVKNFGYNPLKKKCITVIINPQKFIPVQKVYLLKTFMFVDEDLIYLEDQNIMIKQHVDETEICQKKIDVMANVKHFKYIDYIIHENKNNIGLNKQEFLMIKLEEFKNKNIPDQYLINRFKSFGNQKFKEYSDMIEQFQNHYELFNKHLKPAVIKEEQDMYQKKGGYLNYLSQKINEYFVEYSQNQPSQIFHFRTGENDRLMDMQAAYANQQFIQLMEYTIQEYINDCMQSLELPTDQYFKQFKLFEYYQQTLMSKVMGRQEFYLKEEITMPKGIIQLITKNNNLIDVEQKLILLKEGLNHYIIRVYTL